MNFIDEITKDVVADKLHFFAERIDTDPQRVLHQVEGELKSLYIRYGNDWTGRGVVGDSLQEASIAALEAVRAECLTKLQEGAEL